MFDMSNNGQWIACAHGGATHIISAQSHHRSITTMEFKHTVYRLAFSPSSSLLAVMIEPTILLFDTETWTCAHRLKRPEFPAFSCMCFLPDDAVVSASVVIGVWDPPFLQPRFTLYAGVGGDVAALAAASCVDMYAAGTSLRLCKQLNG